MKRIVLAALALTLGLSLASAQTTAPTPTTPAPATPAPAAPAPAAPPTAATPQQMTGKEVREQCRAQVIAQGLRGPARQAAVQDCFAKARPDLARAQQCRQQAKEQGLADKALRDFMKQCRASAG